MEMELKQKLGNASHYPSPRGLGCRLPSEEGNGKSHSSILALRIPWAEDWWAAVVPGVL